MKRFFCFLLFSIVIGVVLAGRTYATSGQQSISFVSADAVTKPPKRSKVTPTATATPLVLPTVAEVASCSIFDGSCLYPTEAPIDANAFPYYTIRPRVESVDIYAGPGKQFDVVGQLSYGQVVASTGLLLDASWWKVERGWVIGKMIEVVYWPPQAPPNLDPRTGDALATQTPVALVAEEESKATATIEGRCAFVITPGMGHDLIVIRSEPSSDSPPIAMLYFGQIALVLGITPDYWMKVDAGWINGDVYLQEAVRYDPYCNVIMPPLIDGVTGKILPTLTPLPTWTPAPTWTPYPTFTPAPTWPTFTPAPTMTSEPTGTPGSCPMLVGPTRIPFKIYDSPRNSKVVVEITDSGHVFTVLGKFGKDMATWYKIKEGWVYAFQTNQLFQSGCGIFDINEVPVISSP